MALETADPQPWRLTVPLAYGAWQRSMPEDSPQEPAGQHTYATSEGVAAQDSGVVSKKERLVSAMVVDGDLLSRRGLRSVLEASGRVYVVGEAEHSGEAADSTRHLRPEVVLLDARTPGHDAFPGLRELVQIAHVLVLAYEGSATGVARALRIGATGYLIHGQYGAEELVDAVVATAVGQPYLSPGAIRVLVDLLGPEPYPHAETPTVVVHHLSRREVEIMERLVMGMTNSEIADALWISQKTVKNHLNHVYAKLGARNRTEAIAVWTRRGTPGTAR